jgi:glycosyltransferase involved in cell wall biosynthesis
VAIHHGLKRYDVILNACNTSVYKLTNPHPRKNFVFVGRIGVSKGIYLLLDAFKLFKQRTQSDWTLTIVGPETGVTEQQMRARAPEYFQSKDIVWVGRKTPEDVVQILNQHQVQIVPSIYVEAFGVVVLEGMASGCLVIGSDGDGIAEAMGKAGYLFKKGDVESLCAQMIKTSQLSEQEYAEQQQLMKENIEKLSLEHCAKQYLDLFQRAL